MITINATNFPDEKFRNYLLKEYAKDGVLSADDVKEIIHIDVRGEDISSLKGIEYFTAMTCLDCGDNQLTELDVSSNTALKELICQDNQLTVLNVSNNTALEVLICSFNVLEELDVSNNPMLVSLACDNNELTDLDVSENKYLDFLYCGGNRIDGASMDALIDSLPQRSNSKFYVVDNGLDDGNACTKAHVAIARAKGWIPYCDYDDKEYDGC